MKLLQEWKDFHLADGNVSKVRMITNKSNQIEFKYKESKLLQAIMLPYRNGNVEMVVILPRHTSDLLRVLSTLSNEKMFRDFKHEKVEFQMPRFKTIFENDYSGLLKKLGIKRAFTKEADFHRIGKDVWLESVKQYASLEVDEHGTEAAAATVVALPAAAALRPVRKLARMIVDHPYILILRDSTTGTILFTGIIFEPMGAKV